MGTVAMEGSSHCLPCIAGSQANKKNERCEPCKEGFFNQVEGGHCKKCPPFTSSRRHESDVGIYEKDGVTKAKEQSAATHCVLDDELHVAKSGQIYRADHFKARNICSQTKFMEMNNLCAAENIIGPISDV